MMNDLRRNWLLCAETRELLASVMPAEETAGFTIGQPHGIPGLVAGHIEAGADEVIFSLPFADAAGISAVGEALGLGRWRAPFCGGLGPRSPAPLRSRAARRR